MMVGMHAHLSVDSFIFAQFALIFLPNNRLAHPRLSLATDFYGSKFDSVVARFWLICGYTCYWLERRCFNVFIINDGSWGPTHQCLIG